MNEALYAVTEQELDINQITQKVIRREAGAVVTFTGTVREFTEGKKTISLRYDAYQSMACKQLQRIGEEIQLKWPEAVTAIWHRTGSLEISDVAVIIAVSTPHRKDAYAANEYAIERIKQIVPIWKQEQWEDGREWIGDQLERTAGVPKKGEQA